MEHKRLTLFAGHYGSGKTNIAVNYALHLAAAGKKVCIADLDIVNPYFRTKDSEKELTEAGIELISPQFANSNVDLPALPAESYRLVQDKSIYGIMDIGGDDRGAYALGRFAPMILEEGNYRMAFVANCYRPQLRPGDHSGNHFGFCRLHRKAELTFRSPSVAAHRGAFCCLRAAGNLKTCTPPAFAGEIFRVTLPKATKSASVGMTISRGGIPMAKLTFQTDLCKGCGLCVNACPKGCLTIAADTINKKGYSPAVMAQPDKCIGCAFCATMCPDCIITVEK